MKNVIFLNLKEMLSFNSMLSHTDVIFFFVKTVSKQRRYELHYVKGEVSISKCNL